MWSSTYVFADLMNWYDKFLKNGPASPWSPNPTFSRGSPLGLRLHFIDIFVEELTKFGHSLLKPEQVRFDAESSVLN